MNPILWGKTATKMKKQKLLTFLHCLFRNHISSMSGTSCLQCEMKHKQAMHTIEQVAKTISATMPALVPLLTTARRGKVVASTMPKHKFDDHDYERLENNMVAVFQTCQLNLLPVLRQSLPWTEHECPTENAVRNALNKVISDDETGDE